MNLTSPPELRALLERHGWRPQKRFGQHFLCSQKVVSAIVSRCSDARGILEVGPGPGVLTQPLSEIAERLIALEIDPISVLALAESAPLAEVREGDVLLANLDEVFLELPEPRVLVSNMPYNITGPLLTAFALVRHRYGRAILMMQKEVGERILAPAGSSDAGSLSIFLQSQFAIEKVVSAPAGAFFPAPKVDSLVLQFTPLDSVLEDDYFIVVRLGFTQPRKTVVNNLLPRFERESIEAALKKLGHPPGVRPHQLGVPEWKALFLALHES